MIHQNRVLGAQLRLVVLVKLVGLLQLGSLGLQFLPVEHFLDFSSLQSLVESLLYMHLGEDLAPCCLSAHYRLELRLLGVPVFLGVPR